MKLQLSQIFELFQPYFLEQTEDISKIKEPVVIKLAKHNLSIETRFSIKQIMRKLELISKDIEEERKKLIEELGDKDENGKLIFVQDGQGVKINKENLDIFDTKFKNFLKEEIEIDITPIDINLIKGFEIDEIGFSRLEFLFKQ